MGRNGNLTNYHSHSLYCDGRAGMEDFVRFAISEGFTSYGFSSMRSHSIAHAVEKGNGA